MQIYLVGGAVRDKLLNLPVKDRDWVVVGATAKELLDHGYQQVGKDFPVFLHPQTKEEYALARTERKSGQGYTGFDIDASPTVTLEDDLLRRDLTINAIAEDGDNNIVDPHGGVKDINDKILRHVSEAFVEDPLRVLRVARFQARFQQYGFSIATETMQMMRDIAQSGELETLTIERVWTETEKALGEASPQAYFSTLRDCGALTILFPEIERLFGIPQTEKYHPEIDTGVHTLMVLEQAALLTDDKATRFAALTHDLGKGITPSDNWPKHHQHERLGVPLVKELCKRLRVPNDFKDLAIKVCEHHLNCHNAFELRAKTVYKLLKSCDVYRNPDILEKFLIACESDSKGRLGFENNTYAQREYLTRCFEVSKGISAKDVATNDLSGKEIGQAIEKARIGSISDVKRQFQGS